MFNIFKNLSPQMVALDFSDNEIKAARVKYVNDIVTVTEVASTSTARNSIKDGRIIDMDKVNGILSMFLKDNFPSAKFVVSTFSSPTAITRELILPVVNSSDVSSIIKYEIENRFPMDTSKYLMEYTILEKFTTEEGEERIRVFVVVMPKEIVEEYYNLFKSLKLTPYAMDFSSNAITKLFKYPMTINDRIRYNPSDTVAVVDLGDTYANVTIIKDGNLRLTRLIQLPDEDIYVSTNYSWINEIDKVIQYYSNYVPESIIGRIFIYGSGAQTKKIAKIMSERLELPVDELHELSYLRLSIIMKEPTLIKYLNAIGAAIRTETN